MPLFGVQDRVNGASDAVLLWPTTTLFFKKHQEPRMTIKLLIADDHEAVRAGLKAMLQGTEIKIVGEATSGDAAVRCRA